MSDAAGADYRLLVRTYTMPAGIPAKGTMVFLHDSLGCIELWRDFPEHLAIAAGYNAFVYDRRGYGGSSPFRGAETEKTIWKKKRTYLQICWNAVP